MPTKTVIVALLGTVLLFGTVISGCQRKRDNREANYSASTGSRRQRGKKPKQYEVASARSVRPAEVLSASAYRPLRSQLSARQNPGQPYSDNHQGYTKRYSPVTAGFTPVNQVPQYQQRQPAQPAYAPTYQMAQTPNRQFEPLPEPVPVSQMGSTGYYTSSIQQPMYAGGVYEAATIYTPSAYTTQPATPSAPYYSNTRTAAPVENNPYGNLPEYAYKPSRKTPAYIPPVRPQSPDLAMAQAQLNPLPVQTPAPSFTDPQMPATLMPLEAIDSRFDFNPAPAPGYNNQVPAITPGQFNAPLPELEPVTYQRVVNRRPQAARPVPAVPVLMSKQEQRQPQTETFGRTRSGNRNEKEHALAPINHSASDSQNDWIPSPATAMYW